MREIELTDMRSILYFMLEYPKWKVEEPDQQYAYGDQTDFA